MTYEEIVAYTKKKLASVDTASYEGHLAAQVNIQGEGEGAFYIELNDGTAVVEPYEYFDRDVVLCASAKDFIDIVDGRKDAVAAYLTGALKVEGSLDKAKSFGEFLKNAKKKEAKKPAARKATTTKAAKTTKKAAKPAEKAETAKKPAQAVKKAAVATAKKVAAKRSADQ